MFDRHKLESLREGVFLSLQTDGAQSALTQTVSEIPTKPSLKKWSQTVDGEIKKLLQQQFRRHRLTEDVAVVALGGYGREELFPYSDLDLLVLRSEHVDTEALGSALQPLWDTGLKMGLVTRSILECRQIMGLELATDMAFFERRFLFGNRELFLSLEKNVLDPYFQHESGRLCQRLLVDLKASLMADRSSLCRVEPHLKNGIGSLRDVHRIKWILALRGEAEAFLGTDLEKLQSAFDYLSRLRMELHLICGRRMDVLEVALQERLSKTLAGEEALPEYALEQYFLHASEVRQCGMVILEKVGEPIKWLKGLKKILGGMTLELGVELLDGNLHLGKKTPSAPSALWMLNLFTKVALYQVSLSMEMRNFLRHRCEGMSTRDFIGAELGEGFKGFLNLETGVGRVLFLMHETGFLELLLPEFKGLRAKVQFSSYHEFTVDHHTLLCVASVDDLVKEKSEDGEVGRSLPRRWLLRAGLLFHDIGKGLPGVHEITGQVLTRNICLRLGWSEEETSVLSFLTYRHMMLSQLAFRREADDQLIQKTCSELKTVERCQILYLLTRLDVQNVGNHTWTTWKGMLLSDVYRRCLDYLSSSVESKDHQLSPVLSLLGDTPEEVVQEWERMKAIHRESGQPQFSLVSYGDVDEITTIYQDRTGSCADMLACLISEGYELLHAVLNEEDQGLAVSVWYVVPNAEKVVPSLERLQNIKAKWSNFANVSAAQLIVDHQKWYPVKPAREDHLPTQNKILWRNDLAKDHTVCEVFTRSRPGLLYRLAKVFSLQGISVQGAKISTCIENAEDVFYLQKDGISFEVNEDSPLHLELLSVLESD